MTCKTCRGRGYSPYCEACFAVGKGPKPTHKSKIEEMFDERMKLIESERKRLAKPPGLQRGIKAALTTYLVEFIVLDANDKFVQSYGRGFKKIAFDQAIEISGFVIPALVPHQVTES